MSFVKEIYQKLSKGAKFISSIVVGIISILGFFFFVRKKLEEEENISNDKIKELESKNNIIDGELVKNKGKIEYIEEKQSDLENQLKEEIVDDSKNLEDFFDKRGF